jgi:phage FluMu protein gp41
MGRELLRRRVACLYGEAGEKHNGPLSADELGMMTPESLGALQNAADAMDVLLALRAGEKIEARGRVSGGGGKPAQSGPLPVSYGPVAPGSAEPSAGGSA